MRSTSTPAPRQGRLRGGVAGTAAAACAVCCAAPVATLLGIGLTGAAATALALAFAGVVFALVVAGATVATVAARRRRARQSACVPAPGPVGPVQVELSTRPDAP